MARMDFNAKYIANDMDEERAETNGNISKNAEPLVAEGWAYFTSAIVEPKIEHHNHEPNVKDEKMQSTEK